jgi:hypothetical protein
MAIRPSGRPGSCMSQTMNSKDASTLTPASAAGPGCAAAVSRHLLTTVASEPATASHADIMHAVAQVAREQLSQRWVECDTADRAGQGAPGLLPVDGVPDRPHAVQRAGRAGPEGRDGTGGARARLHAGRPGGHRGRCRAGQRRPGPPGGLFPGQHGHAGTAQHRLRHPLRVRHVQAAHPGRAPGRTAGPLAGRRHALGVSALGRALPGALRGLGGTCCRTRHWRPSGALPARSERRPTTW